jgi:alpha-ribazole phosphatase
MSSDGIILVLIRHGAAVSADGRCLGHTDLPLAPSGIDAIAALAERWHALAPSSRIGVPARVVSSDLRRASESARIVADRWALPVERDTRLREMNFGEWDGRLWSDIETADGDRLRAWTETWTDASCPGGEALSDVIHRADSWLDETLDATPPSSTIAVVSHAGWIRAALCRVLRAPPSEIFRFAVDHARATVVAVHPAGADLMASNVTEVP